MWETLAGGVVGGALRLIPEALTFFDKKNDRKHELAMLDKQVAADTLRGSQALEKTKVEGDISQTVKGMEAFVEAVKGQAKPLENTGSKWINFVNGLNQSVRPVIAYLLVSAYLTIKIMGCVALWQDGVVAMDIAKIMYTEDDQAILAGVLNFYFLNRVFDKKRR